MNHKLVHGGVLVLLALTLPSVAMALEPTVLRIYDDYEQLIFEQSVEPSNPLLVKTVHYLHFAPYGSQHAAKPGGGGADPGTDCESDAYKLTGWHWNAPYSARAASYASSVSASLSEWDSNTGASIGGGVSSGNGPAGVLDGVNQIVWESLGASSTVAVTTTWSYRGSGEAVESDGQYNTYYAWATNGDANSMDVESVTQHETGHTFGLNHPTSTSTNACLTMYAYVSYGATHGRTLGDGDVLGIKAIYGN